MTDQREVDRAVAEHRAAGETHAGEDVVAIGARRLVREVWRLVNRGVIDARSPAADAALDLRDSIDPKWDPTAGDDGRFITFEAHDDGTWDVTFDGVASPDATTEQTTPLSDVPLRPGQSSDQDESK